MKGIAFWTITLAVVVFATTGSSGCRKAQDGPKKDTAKKAHDDHPDEGPHGGALAEWGAHEYHAEFTVDHKAKKATVYILDKSAKKAAPIDAETITLTIDNVKPKLVLTLKADREIEEPQGKSSRFSGIHDQLATEMEFEGEISGKVGKTSYAGRFEEEKHDHGKEKSK